MPGTDVWRVAACQTAGAWLPALLAHALTGLSALGERPETRGGVPTVMGVTGGMRGATPCPPPSPPDRKAAARGGGPGHEARPRSGVCVRLGVHVGPAFMPCADPATVADLAGGNPMPRHAWTGAAHAWRSCPTPNGSRPSSACALPQTAPALFPQPLWWPATVRACPTLARAVVSRRGPLARPTGARLMRDCA